MKKILLPAILACALTTFGQQLDFARTQNQLGTEASIKAVHDHSGRLILTGYTQIISASGGTNGASNTWVKQYDANGLLLWSVQTNYSGSVGQEGAEVTGITVDSEDNVYITGVYLSGSVTLGGVQYSEPANQNLNLFYAKISSAGAVQWVKGLGETHFSNNICIGTTITATPDDAIVLTGGYFKGLVIGNDTLPGNPALSGGMTPFGFYAKLDADGMPIWSKRFENLVTGAYNSFSGIGATEVDADGNLFFMTGIDSAVVFGNDTVSSPYLTAVVKTDAAGNFIRAVVPQSSYDITRDIALDVCGNVLLLGEFLNAIQIENTLLTAGSMRPVFVAKFDNDLDLAWLKQFHSTGADLSGSIACNDRNDVFFDFEFWGELNLDGAHTPSPSGTMDAVLIKLDSAGNYVWSKHSSGPGNTSVSGVSVSPSNTVVHAGRYQGQENFDGTVINGTPGNLPDVWFAAYGDTTLAELPVDCSGSATTDELAPAGLAIYPNPAGETITIASELMRGLTVTDLSGRVVFSVKAIGPQVVSVAAFPEGMYCLQATLQTGATVNAKFVVKH